MKRIGLFPVEMVHALVQHNVSSVNLGGCKVKLSGSRMRVFATKGAVCVTCRRVGRFYAIERHKDSTGFHLNLYTDCGMLMTQDHIQPQSKGGTNDLSNLQPMCAGCNVRKGNS